MTAEIISIGTELLLGSIVNTDARFLAKHLAGLGFDSYHQSTVGDNKERLMALLALASSRSDLIFLTGGLGPTQDDMTVEALASFLGRPLFEDEHTKDRIKKYFENSTWGEIAKNNWKQALIIEGATVVDNPGGTAPGQIVEKDGTYYILLPGPPAELEDVYHNGVEAFLKKLDRKTLLTRNFRITGIGESRVEEMVIDLIDAQTNPTLATYAKEGEVTLRLTAGADSADEAEKLLLPYEEIIRQRFTYHIANEAEDESLAETVYRLLEAEGKTLALAESCTGGALSSAIVDLPGASKVLQCSYVTYSNEAKVRELLVREETLNSYGAVSEQCAMEMAEGARKKAGTDYALSVTGIAGPDGGTKEKPVGLVYIGLSSADGTKCRRVQAGGNRRMIRTRSVKSALDFLREELLRKGEEA